MAVQKRSGLGRGLDALMSDVGVTLVSENSGIQEVNENSISEIDINSIMPNSSQPRKQFNDDKLEELATSIEEHGIIQPLLVRPNDNGFEIVAGERRWRAARKAGLKTVPCIIRSLNERENILIALIENMQREDLSAIEEALAYEEMIDKHGLSQSEIARSMGKSRPYIANALRLLKLPEEIKDYVIKGDLSGGHARTIAGLNDEKKQLYIARKVINSHLSVRALEQMVADEKEKDNKSTNKKPRNKKDSYIVSSENELRELFGTKINIKSDGQKGKIEIDFYSPDELNRILELIKTIRQ